MCDLETFKIDLKGLREDITMLHFNLDDAFFKAVDGSEVRSGKVVVSLKIHKTAGAFEMDFHTEGTVTVPCDICLDDMEQAVCADNRLMAKFGEEDTDVDDELVVVDEAKGVIDVAWLIYEFVALSVPVKHVHEEGGCNKEMLEALEEHSAGQHDEGQDRAVDSRWSELEKLKTIIKD